MRINTDLLDEDALGWSEIQAWDEIVQYYQAAVDVTPGWTGEDQVPMIGWIAYTP